MTTHTKSPTAIFIWTIPRTCSTVLAKCMSFVDGAEIWMEPYCASYFNETLYNPEFKKGDPHMEVVRARMRASQAGVLNQITREEIEEQLRASSDIIDQKEISYSWTKNQLEATRPDSKYIIVKDPSFAVVGHLEFLPDVPNQRHGFLIRHPAEVYASFKRMQIKTSQAGESASWESVHVANDVPHLPVEKFFQIHHRHWKNLRENAELEPVVMDVFDLMTRPEEVLPKFFEALGVPFDERYLEWDDSDEVVAKTWKGSADFVLISPKKMVYSRAVNSARFEAPKLPRGTLPTHLKITPEMETYIGDAMPFYEEMYACRIK